jgi:hypothetical protein
VNLTRSSCNEVATRSGCGRYFAAGGAFNLDSVYVQVRHTSTGAVLLQQTGTIAEGESVDAGSL